MNKFKFLILCILILPFILFAQNGKNITINTESTQLVYRIQGTNLLFDYYGAKLDNIKSIYHAGVSQGVPAYPAFGIKTKRRDNLDGSMAIRATHADGGMSLNLKYNTHEVVKLDENVSITTIFLKDDVYPFYVNIHIKSFYNEDVIELSTEISHQETSPVTLYSFASGYFSIKAQEYWLNHFHGTWGHEFIMQEEKLQKGIKEIRNEAGVRNTQSENPTFFITLNQEPSEESGEVIAGTLAWTGNYKLGFQVKTSNTLNVIAGINEYASEYILEQGEKFKTPALVLTYSKSGKGKASRNLHDYARKYKILAGDKERKILLNSWEGVYFNFDEQKIVEMIDDIASIGGELFVLDDGWFGNKYERNSGKQGLGDWQVSKRKLPNGINYLIDEAEKRGVSFGIWVEPEMINTTSEFYEKHPDWVIQQSNREIIQGRGGTQVTLDLSNPKAQNFVFSVVNNLLNNYSRLNYIKWDANNDIANYGSTYLSANKQSHLYIEYQRGLENVLKRLRKNHPDVTMQVCASGGGRVSYGHLPYFHEFWTSDNTDALKRIYMQWGTSHAFPAIAMASHVSANKNHQTGREIPLKFRFDVAMTGRLGLELQPKDMTESQLLFSKSAIKTYKEIRPIVQFGDQYRLISPFDNNHIASLMYVDKNKKSAVFFAYHLVLNNTETTNFPAFKMKGLDPEAKYKIAEINLDKVSKDTRGRVINKEHFRGSGQVYSGSFLMNIGINLSFKREYESVVLKLIKE